MSRRKLRQTMIDTILNRDEDLIARIHVTDTYFISAWERSFHDKPLPRKPEQAGAVSNLTDDELLWLYTNACLEVFK